MNYNEIMMGKLTRTWMDGASKTITISVTEDCNLACTYCYMTGKNNKKKLSESEAKKVVDYILKDRKQFDDHAVVWEFVGGEPFLEIDLIDKISDYIKQQMFLLDHPWFNSYRFNFSTNGVLYSTPKVQRYLMKNRSHVSIGISIDGNKIKHDMSRIKRDGSGSYDDVVKNIPLWLSQYPSAQTKATFCRDDLPYLKDSIVSLWDLGIKTVAANVVFEDVWQDGDDIAFENQLKELADYILDNNMWKEYSVRFFDPNIGYPLPEEEKDNNFCGAGKMLAVDCDGKFFPCLRFLDFTLNNHQGLCVGDAEKGIDINKLRPFEKLSPKTLNKKECLDCEVATGCAWCTGFNYDMSETGTIFHRATFICKMHKANVRANKYFWNRFEHCTGMKSPRRDSINSISTAKSIKPYKYLQFITSDNITPHCAYRNINNYKNTMSEDLIKKGVEFALKNDLIPVFLGQSPNIDNLCIDSSINILSSKSTEISKNSIIIYDNYTESKSDQEFDCILLVSEDNLSSLHELIYKVYKFNKRINIILEDIEKWNDYDFEVYSKELDKLVALIVDVTKNGDNLEINVLTDLLYLNSMCNCEAGENSYSLAPNGKIYSCPAFYFDDMNNYIGDLDSGINTVGAHLFELENSPVCSECDTYSCRRCKYLNKKLTNEFNIPSLNQCIISNIERNKSRTLQIALIKEDIIVSERIIKEVPYFGDSEKTIRKDVEKYVG